MDESKQADIENLGDCLRASATVNRLVTSRSRLSCMADHERNSSARAEFTGLHQRGRQSVSETYNQLNAYFAAIPGNVFTEPTKALSAEHNYADLSFLFTIFPGKNAITGFGVIGRARNQHAIFFKPAQWRSRTRLTWDDRSGKEHFSRKYAPQRFAPKQMESGRPPQSSVSRMATRSLLVWTCTHRRIATRSEMPRTTAKAAQCTLRYRWDTGVPLLVPECGDGHR